jgi:hypothetical protein
MGGLGRDCRQSDQYRSIPGSNQQRIEIEPRAAITNRGKRKDGDKMAARKQPTGWVQYVAPPQPSFLRRKVARIACAEETKRMESIEKAIYRMVSESSGRNESERIGDQQYKAVQYARFADDLVVLVDSHARHRWIVEALKKRLREEFEKLRVEINEEEKPNGGPQEERKFRIPGIRVSTCPELKGTMATPVHAQAQKANSATGEATGDFPAKREPASRAGDRTD